MLGMEILTFRGLQHRKAMSLQFRRTSLGIKEDSHIWVLTILSLENLQRKEKIRSEGFFSFGCASVSGIMWKSIENSV